MVLPWQPAPRHSSKVCASLSTWREKTSVIEYRYTEGKIDRYPALAAELVRLKVDVIVSAGSTATRAVKEATSTIPIVMSQDSDPVGNGFVASLARPGGNITGLSTLAPEIRGKQLELLKEIVSRLSRVAVFETSTQPGNAQALKEVDLVAGAFGVKLQYLDVLSPKDIESAFRAAVRARADAVLMMVPGRVAISRRKEIADLAVKSRLPAIYPQSEYVVAGGLTSYGVSECRLGPARRYVCRQDFERQKARGSSGRAADQVRVHHQSASGKTDRPDDSTERAWRGRTESSNDFRFSIADFRLGARSLKVFSSK